MKIGIDATFTPHGGSLGHLLEFIKELSNRYTKSDLILYTKKENIDIIRSDILNKCTIRLVRSASYGNLFRVIWGQIVLPISSSFDGLDILFCPGNISPMIKTTKIKAQWIATVGPFSKDVYVGLKLRDKFHTIVNKYFILLSGYSSNVVIHESYYSKQLFEDKYKYRGKFQFLIECGKDDFYKPFPKQIKSSNLISLINKEDLLCVSHLYSYKNIERLIGAFASYKKNNATAQKLYIAGKKADPRYCKRLEKLVFKFGLQDDIIFTGMVAKDELRFAYSTCKLFVFPSLCESSGYTLIEAMSCGAAILASDITAMPFTCRDGADYFDAYSEEALLMKLETLLANDNELSLMKKKSLFRASEMIDYKTATQEFLQIVDTKLKDL